MPAEVRAEVGRPGRSVSSSQDDREYSAWVPAPLPPVIQWDGTLASALAQAGHSLGELAGIGRNLPNPHLLISPFLRKEAVLSSRIEGTQATIADVYAYEAQLPLPGMAEDLVSTGRGRGDVQEVLNYVRALNHGLAVIAERPVTLSLVRDLHKILMTGVRGQEKTPGEFRERQNVIGPPGADLSTATYIPPPVLHMRDCLEGLERYILTPDNQDHPLVRIALIHYQFEAIHPFNDGNGRLGRLLISLLTVAWGMLPHPLLYLSAYFEGERETYYAALRGVTERGAWPEWLAFFLNGVREQALDAARRAKRLEDLRVDFTSRVADARMQAIANKLIAGLFAQPVVSIASAAAIMDAKYHLARRYVHKLIELGVLTPYSQIGHTDYFIAVEIMAAVGDK